MDLRFADGTVVRVRQQGVNFSETDGHSQPTSLRRDSKHLLNLPLVTQDDEVVRFYDDLVKDKKVAITFIDTRLPAESRKVSQNLAELQKFFGSRMGKDIHLYTITQNPRHDTPEVLKAGAARYDVGPGWTFLTGNPTNVDKLRQALGFGSEFAEDRADPAFSIGGCATAPSRRCAGGTASRWPARACSPTRCCWTSAPTRPRSTRRRSGTAPS